MNVSLTQQLEKFINKQVTSGRYQTASEVIRDGLRMMQELNHRRELEYARLKREVQRGVDDIEAGRIRDFDPKRIMALARKRRAARQKRKLA